MAGAVRHEWYQTDEAVTVTVFVKNAPKDAAVTIRPGEIAVAFDTAAEPFSFELGPLFADVVPDKSTHRVLSTKIEIKLVKAAPGKWADITGAAAPAAAEPGRAKNWDALVRDLGSTEEADDGPASFFRKLYDGADEDTKRAMMKSYVESNGTALSTNWSEVKKAPVKTEPPNGMQERKW
ncbi:SGS domain-containing protein [Dipodascopsis tothii]|uniref:SGS domain-containing protein n=1 Tax=Dipodascopsis tothii TaxID=44089 RepID=UPI0034CDCFE7